MHHFHTIIDNDEPPSSRIKGAVTLTRDAVQLEVDVERAGNQGRRTVMFMSCQDSCFG